MLTACIWYLKEEKPECCDIPHVFAMVTGKDTELLELLQKNPQTEQMTMSIYNAMERGADAFFASGCGRFFGCFYHFGKLIRVVAYLQLKYSPFFLYLVNYYLIFFRLIFVIGLNVL